MMQQNKPVYLFLLQVVLWLPFAFVGWYLLSLMLCVPVNILLELVLTTFWTEWIESVNCRGYMLEIVTTITPTHIKLLPGQEAVFTFEKINSLNYSYGLPFLIALIAASPDTFPKKIGYIVLTWIILLLPVQIFGLLGLVLKDLVYQTTPEVMYQIAGDGLGKDVIIFVYQFGSLILPAITPLLAWIFLYRDYLQELAPQFIKN